VEVAAGAGVAPGVDTASGKGGIQYGTVARGTATTGVGLGSPDFVAGSSAVTVGDTTVVGGAGAPTCAAGIVTAGLAGAVVGPPMKLSDDEGVMAGATVV
jgi:hypothetical protein